jgi:hypothetical protein
LDTVGTLTPESSRPSYKSPSPVKSEKMRDFTPEVQIPKFDLPSEANDGGSKAEDCLQQIQQLPRATQLSELQALQIEKQDTKDMIFCTVERVEAFMNKYAELAYRIPEVEIKSLKIEILKGLNLQPQHQVNQ